MFVFSVVADRRTRI